VWSLIRLGMLDDPRVQRAIDWLTTHARFDDGDSEAPTGWPYDGWEMCWGRHSCHMGVVKTLKALAEIPPPQRSPRCGERSTRRPSSSSGITSTDAVTTCGVTPNQAGDGSAFL